MTREQQKVKEWMQKFGQKCPEKPTKPSMEDRKLRAKMHLEETLETLRGLGFDVLVQEGDGQWTSLHDMHKKGDRIHLEERWQPNLIDIIDGCEDSKVIAEGTLIACGVPGKVSDCKCFNQPCGCRTDIDPHFDEVMRANEAKFWTWREWTDYWAKHSTPGYSVDAARPHPTNYTRDSRIWIVKDKDGKVIKPPSFTPPNHEQFLK